MNKVVKAALFLALFPVLPVQADPAVGNGSIGQIPANYSALAAAATTVVKSSPGIFYGVSDLNSSAQISAITCFDNATTNTGPIIFQGIVGVLPPSYPANGVLFSNGLTCNIAVALTGAGVAVYFR